MAKEAKGSATNKSNVVPAQWGPRSVMPRLEQEIERFFGERWPRMFDSSFYQTPLESTVPKVDVVDRESEVVVRAELPGFKKKEIDVSLNDSTMTIKASHESEQEDKEEDYYRKEISKSFVSRTVSLPAEVDGEKAKATFTDGMLELTVPKLAKSKRQKITISD
jgi:HSP20 family protein